MADQNAPALFTANEIQDFQLFKSEMDVSELIEENLADEEFSPSELTRINVPTGGGQTFEIPTVFGPEASREIEAIIIKVQPMRMYWKTGVDDGEQGPPDCRSDDMITGIGDPGGDCATCPMNQWESDQKSGGKLCKEKRNIFILSPQTLLPYNLSCPVKSIGNLKKYKQDLTREGYGLNRVSTRITLGQDKNKAGIKYSQLQFQVGKILSTEQTNMVREYKKAFDKIFERAAQKGPSAEGPDFG